MAPELMDGRFRARKFMHKYNNHFPDDATPDSLTADREKMLKEHFGKVGKGVYVEPPLNVDYGCNISVGENFYSNFKYAYLKPQHLDTCDDLYVDSNILQPCHPRLWNGAHR